VYDIFVVVARACVFNSAIVPLTFVGGGVDVVDAVDVVWEGGVHGACEDLWVGGDDGVCVGVYVCVFEQVDFADFGSESGVGGEGVVDVVNPFICIMVFLPCLWFDENVDGCGFVEGVPNGARFL
jgi:hypothetical protein